MWHRFLWSTVTITATMQRAQTNGINAIAELGYVNFYLGGTDGTLLGSVNVTTGSNGAYTAALTLDDNIWAKGFNIGSKYHHRRLRRRGGRLRHRSGERHRHRNADRH